MRRGVEWFNSGPYVGVHRLSALEFLARWVHHVPDPYETRVRYYGAYATRRRLWWRRHGVVPEGTRGASAPGAAQFAAKAPAGDWPALRARKRRWAELLSRVFEIEVSVCPACTGAMRIVAFVTAQQAVRKILAHLVPDRRAGELLAARRSAATSLSAARARTDVRPRA